MQIKKKTQNKKNQLGVCNIKYIILSIIYVMCILYYIV